MVVDNCSMTQPRYIVGGRVCFITARAVRRMFLFRPDREFVRVFEYLLAVAANSFGIRVHEVLCMSNHFHILLTDVQGRLPDFMNYFDSLLARSVNALRGTSGSVFEQEYGLVAEADDDKIVAHAVYTLANPCAAHLVRRSRQWPGFSTLRLEYGQTVTIERPKVGLWQESLEERARRRPREGRRDARRGKPSRLPEVVEFKLERPPEAAAADVRDRVSRVRNKLPDAVDEPVIAKVEADANPIIWIAFSSDKHSALEVTDVANRIVKPRLQTLPGAADVRVFGERKFAMRIWLDKQRLAAYQLTPADVEDAIGLEAARRSLRRRARWVYPTLITLVSLLADRLSGVAPTLHAMRIALGVERVLVALRSVAEMHLGAVARPLGFRARVSA